MLLAETRKKHSGNTGESPVPHKEYSTSARLPFVPAVFFSVALLWLGAGVAAGQRPTPPPPVTYSVDVSLVEVDAVVTDAKGRVVRDLRREDFQILEDGQPQTIDRVSFVDIPIGRGDLGAPAVPSATDVRSNLRQFSGRLYILLLDDLHTARPRSEPVRAAARLFVEQHFESGDLAAVVHVAAGSGASQTFTTDRRLLLASIDRFAGRKLPSETLSRLDEYNRQVLLSGRTPENVADPDEGPRAHDARSIFDTIANAAERVAAVRGRRKALIWFGEGVGYDMFDIAGRRQASEVRESSRAAVAAASRASLAIYGIDARGPGGQGDEAMQMSGFAQDPATRLNASGLDRELLRSQENLRRVSNDTGGFAVVNTGDFARAFERIVKENSAYYLLGYYPAGKRRDGGSRRIEVRVARAGVTVRARRGYVAPREQADPTPAEEMPPSAEHAESGAPPALREALVSPVPQSALPMAVHVAAFKGRGPRASVLVTVEYAASAFEGSGPAPDRDRLETSVIAVTPAGEVEASDHATVMLNVQPETRRAMRVLGFRTHARLELPPGRYQVRAAALATGTGLVGSVHHDLEVPDFAASPLRMSGLAVTSFVAGYTPTAALDERMRAVLPAPPTASRDFRNDEPIALFAEVYQAGGAPAGEVTLRTQVRNEAGEVVFERQDVREAEELHQSKNGYSLQVPLRTFAPGDYVLRLEAESRAGGPERREMAFHVWEVPPSESLLPAGSLPVVPVAKGALSGVGEPREVVARNDAEWQALWRLLSLRAAAPAVAFENTMIVAVFLGARPIAGYEPEIVGRASRGRRAGGRVGRTHAARRRKPAESDDPFRRRWSAAPRGRRAIQEGRRGTGARSPGTVIETRAEPSTIDPAATGSCGSGARRNEGPGRASSTAGVRLMLLAG